MNTTQRIALMCAAVLLGACEREAPKAEVVRPVRTVMVEAQHANLVAEFSGDVRPRYESRLGFRVGGKILKRLVDVGAQITKGQELARLDPQDLKLAEAASAAKVAAAESEYKLAKSDLARYEDLRGKNFISQAELDRRRSTHDAALASLESARAEAHIQDNQSDYASLRADADGVITAIEAEAGQVVSAGQTVLRLAQSGEKEIQISVPEDKVDAVRRAPVVVVSLWAAPERELPGQIREIAPAADPASRTYGVRVSVPKAPEQMRWGMTAVVRFGAASEVPTMRLPLSALLHKDGADFVWVFDPESGTVQPKPVNVSGTNGKEAVLSGGLVPGQIVVTAGAHLLQAGQKVKLLPAEATPTAEPKAMPAVRAGGQG